MRTALMVVVVAFGATQAAWTQPPTPAAGATIEVRVAVDAAVTFDGYATQSRGPTRTFFTPDLAPGKTFTYEIAAVWNHNGKPRRFAQQVTVRGGETTVVDFTRSDTAARKDKIATAHKEFSFNTGERDGAKTRTFNFTYAATVKDLSPGKEISLWLPIPSDSPEQTIVILSKNLPGQEQIGKEKQYGNRILHLKAKANEQGKVPLEITFKVMRKEVRTAGDPSLFLKPLAQEQIKRFLEPDSMVPVGGKGLTLLENKKLPGDQFGSARVLYDVVNDHMKYSKEGKGWGRGDSDWACDSKFGNCTDFHSLFISLARAQKIPAKFEIGFPIPPERGQGKVLGYHCWAWFLPDGKGWVPVDISEANRHPKMREYYFGNLTEDRVTFSTGRDLTLVPPQKGPPLNFFVYPYVEVEGQPYPNEKIDRMYTYQDVK